MTYELIVEIALKSFVTSGIALALIALLKDRSPAERSWVAHIGLLATLVLPLATIFLPKYYVESAPAPVAEPAAAAAIAPALESATAAPAAAEAPSALGPLLAIDLGSLGFWFYALVAAALFLVTFLAIARLFVLRGSASVLVEPKWLSALAHAQRRMGFKHGTALLVSDALASPVSWGVLRPIILLNEQAVNSQAEAEAIIAHELAHVAHLDWAKLLVARAATALFWFNPLVWFLAKACHQLREEAADDAVLLSDVPSTDYAALLIGAARHDSKPLLLAANGVAPGRGSLKRRVTRVLDSKLRRAPAQAGWSAACLLAGLLIAAPLSAVTGVTPPAHPSKALVASAPAAPAPFKVVAEAAASSARLAIAAATDAAPEALISAPAPVPAAAHVGPTTAIAKASVTSAIAPLLAVSDEAAHPEARPSRNVVIEKEKVREEVTSAIRSSYPTPEQLVALRVHRISADYIRGLAEAGYPELTHDQLMAAGIHRVTPEYIRELSEAGYRGLSISQLTSLRVHRVDSSFIRGLAEVGYANLSYKDLVNAAVHGVTPKFIKEMRALGYDRISPEQVIGMRIHGMRGPDRKRNWSPRSPEAPPLPPPPVNFGEAPPPAPPFVKD